MLYDLYLFDADDTLFDFKASEKAAFKKTILKFEIKQHYSEIFPVYQKMSDQLWQQYEKGEVEKDLLRTERFRRTAETCGFSAPETEMSESYLDFLANEVNMIEGAIELCSSLSQKAEVGIVTNGIEDVQKRRLEASGLKEFISFMVVSDESGCGYPKPDERFFDYAFKKAKRESKEKVLVIGDRLETDILGAQNYGLDACWYNPQAKSKHLPVNPKYDIRDLGELKSIAGLA